jgi:hypothetical protein
MAHRAAMGSGVALGTHRTRCVRWLGLDHNPLRRTADRAETGIRLAVVMMFLTVVPLLTLVAGRTTDHMALREARAQRAADHHITAVLTQAAPMAGTTDPYTAVEVTWVPARWPAPDGGARSGMILAAVGAPKGTAVPIWVDPAGQITGPPVSHRIVVADVFIAMTITAFVLTVGVLGLQALAGEVLDRRRIKAWEAEWLAIGPLWTGHRT